MSSDFSLEFKERYIHLIHAPDYEISPESNDILWAELAKACRKYKCLKVLTEGSNQKRRITSMDAYQSGAQAAESIPGMTLAICIDDYTPDDITQFLKMLPITEAPASNSSTTRKSSRLARLRRHRVNPNKDFI